MVEEEEELSELEEEEENQVVGVERKVTGVVMAFDRSSNMDEDDDASLE